MSSPIHRIVTKLAESQLLDRFAEQLPFEARNALGNFSSSEPSAAIRRESVTAEDIVGGVGVLLGDLEQGGSVGGVNLLKGTVRGGTLRGCNVSVADVHDGDIRGVNVLAGEVLGGEVQTKVHVGEVDGGRLNKAADL